VRQALPSAARLSGTDCRAARCDPTFVDCHAPAGTRPIGHPCSGRRHRARDDRCGRSAPAWVESARTLQSGCRRAHRDPSLGKRGSLAASSDINPVSRISGAFGTIWPTTPAKQDLVSSGSRRRRFERSSRGLSSLCEWEGVGREVASDRLARHGQQSRFVLGFEAGRFHRPPPAASTP